MTYHSVELDLKLELNLVNNAPLIPMHRTSCDGKLVWDTVTLKNVYKNIKRLFHGTY